MCCGWHVAEYKLRCPQGHKTKLYKRAKLEKFAPYVMKNGLVCRLSVYDDSQSQYIHDALCFPSVLSVCRSCFPLVTYRYLLMSQSTLAEVAGLHLVNLTVTLSISMTGFNFDFTTVGLDLLSWLIVFSVNLIHSSPCI